MTHPTRRGAALLGVAALTYLAARVVGTWELYLLALAFAGMVVVAWALVAAGARRLVVDRRVSPEQPVAGDPLEFHFRVTTRWRLPGLHVALHGATGAAPGLPETVLVDDVSLHRERRASAGPQPARRGLHRLSAFVAGIEDPLGLVRARRPAGEPLRLTVAPRLEALATCAPCARRGTRRGGGRRRLPTRNAWEFRGIRPHIPGEPVERVDWKSTAKTGSLMLREMEADTEDDLTVLLNAPPARGRDGRPHSASADERLDAAFETAVVAAGSMAAFTLRGGHAVSLLLPDAGWRDLRLTPDAAGRRRLMAALAEAEPQGLYGLGSSLPAILDGRARRRRDMLALVTTQVDPGLVAALGRLRHQGVAVSVVHVLPEARPATASAGRPASSASGATDEDGPALALAAVGARYFPVIGAQSLRAALAGQAGGRPVRVAR